MTNPTDWYSKYLFEIPQNVDRIDILGGGISRQHYEDVGSFVLSCHVPLGRTDMLVSNHPEYFPAFSLPYISKKSWDSTSDSCDRPQYTDSLISVEHLTVWIKQGHSDKKKNYLETIRYNKKLNNLSLNTGQTGYLWALAQTPKEIHLWGMDGFETWEAHHNYYEPHLELAHQHFPWGQGANPNVEELQQRTKKWKEIIKPNTVIHLNNNTIYI